MDGRRPWPWPWPWPVTPAGRAANGWPGPRFSGLTKPLHGHGHGQFNYVIQIKDGPASNLVQDDLTYRAILVGMLTISVWVMPYNVEKICWFIKTAAKAVTRKSRCSDTEAKTGITKTDCTKPWETQGTKHVHTKNTGTTHGKKMVLRYVPCNFPVKLPIISWCLKFNKF
jgi:hypothetical protein